MLTHRLRRLGADDGFTLIEMLVVIVLLGVLFAAFSLVISSTVTTSSEITNQSVLQTEARAAVDTLVRDLRQTYNGDPAGSPSIETASPALPMTATTLTFDSPDRTYSASGPSTSFHLRRISYQLVSGSLQRAVDTSTNTTGWPWTWPGLASWTTVLGNVQNTDVFSYYYNDTSTTPATVTVATTPAQVEWVVVKVALGDPQGHGRQFTYSETAQLR